jgi:hypothetical protein
MALLSPVKTISCHFHILLLLLLPKLTAQFQACPLLGPSFPAPTNLLNSPTITTALQNLTSILNTLVLINNSSTHGPVTANETSFSIAIFSSADHSQQSKHNIKNTLYQYHYTSQALASSNSSLGVRAVDENSIYRIGSISKLLTVYTFLLELGDGYWDSPVTRYVPELAAAAANCTQKDPVTHVQWKDVTLCELASQMAGVGRDCKLCRCFAMYVFGKY